MISGDGTGECRRRNRRFDSPGSAKIQHASSIGWRGNESPSRNRLHCGDFLARRCAAEINPLPATLRKALRARQQAPRPDAAGFLPRDKLSLHFAIRCLPRIDDRVTSNTDTVFHGFGISLPPRRRPLRAAAHVGSRVPGPPGNPSSRTLRSLSRPAEDSGPPRGSPGASGDWPLGASWFLDRVPESHRHLLTCGLPSIYTPRSSGVRFSKAIPNGKDEFARRRRERWVSIHLQLHRVKIHLEKNECTQFLFGIARFERTRRRIARSAKPLR